MKIAVEIQVKEAETLHGLLIELGKQASQAADIKIYGARIQLGFTRATVHKPASWWGVIEAKYVKREEVQSV